MQKIILPAMIFLFLSMPFPCLFGDIIITNDDMILNGKILKDEKPGYVDFANYHGTFKIDYRQIKKIIRTESFEVDVKIIEEMGKPANKEEIKTNYEAGLEKLKKQKFDDGKGKKKIQSSDYIIFFSAFYNLNFGKLDSLLHDSLDFSAACDMPLYQLDQFRIIKMLHFSGIRGEISYFYSKNDERSITGFRASAGPLWQIPVSIGKIHFKYGIFPALGIGRYSVSGPADSAASVKWNACVTTGPFFKISSIIICPQLKFDYIYDGSAPLYRIGFGIGAGFFL